MTTSRSLRNQEYLYSSCTKKILNYCIDRIIIVSLVLLFCINSSVAEDLLSDLVINGTIKFDQDLEFPHGSVLRVSVGNYYTQHGEKIDQEESIITNSSELWGFDLTIPSDARYGGQVVVVDSRVVSGETTLFANNKVITLGKEKFLSLPPIVLRQFDNIDN